MAEITREEARKNIRDTLRAFSRKVDSARNSYDRIPLPGKYIVADYDDPRYSCGILAEEAAKEPSFIDEASSEELARLAEICGQLNKKYSLGVRDMPEGVNVIVNQNGKDDVSKELSQYDINKINTLHPDIRDSVKTMLQNLKKDGVKVEITLALRTYEEQDILFAKGRNDKGEVSDQSKVVTNARGGQSYHNFGLAFDLTVYDKDNKKTWKQDSEEWKKVIAEGKNQGFEAGAEWADFPDLPHFQKTFGLTTKQLRTKKEKDETKNGYVNVK